MIPTEGKPKRQRSRVAAVIAVQKPAVVAVCVVLGVALCGCRRKAERDIHSESKMKFQSPEWNKAAAEDISVRTVSVLQRPASQVSFVNERDMLKLTPEEKDAIAAKGVTGELEVVYTAGSGSGSKEVRVVIIQRGPLKANARLPVPSSGSAIYVERDGALTPLLTNSPPSALTLEIFQEKKETTFFLDYPRDRTRYGGAVFWWDENGRFHEL
jgi:hypothetical protein